MVSENDKTDSPARPSPGGYSRATGAAAHGADKSKALRLEMSAATMRRLLENGQLSAADFRCLDCESKQCIWRLFLECCAKNAYGW